MANNSWENQAFEILYVSGDDFVKYVAEYSISRNVVESGKLAERCMKEKSSFEGVVRRIFPSVRRRVLRLGDKSSSNRDNVREQKKIQYRDNALVVVYRKL